MTEQRCTDTLSPYMSVYVYKRSSAIADKLRVLSTNSGDFV